MLSEHEAELPGDAEIDVAGSRRPPAARRRRSNTAAIRTSCWAVVAVDQRTARRRRNEEPHPLRRPEHVLALLGWLRPVLLP